MTHEHRLSLARKARFSTYAWLICAVVVAACETEPVSDIDTSSANVDPDEVSPQCYVSCTREVILNPACRRKKKNHYASIVFPVDPLERYIAAPKRTYTCGNASMAAAAESYAREYLRQEFNNPWLVVECASRMRNEPDFKAQCMEAKATTELEAGGELIYTLRANCSWAEEDPTTLTHIGNFYCQHHLPGGGSINRCATQREK